jgi:hypothetical protein
MKERESSPSLFFFRITEYPRCMDMLALTVKSVFYGKVIKFVNQLEKFDSIILLSVLCLILYLHFVLWQRLQFYIPQTRIVC